ncbi:ABC transporter substrate-binding protein [Alcaligenaceae bacterium]|nr:ABC transporter substrate-binding protein [Alcaligenaceae bacterium]
MTYLKNKLRRTLITAVASISLITLSGVAQSEPTSGGKLNLMVQPEPPTLNLGINKLGPTSFVGSKIYEGLISLSPTLEPIPRLAESWTVSEDGKTYTFNLRKNVSWHDGAPFTSADVLFSYTKYLPATTPRTKTVMAQVESVTAPDDHTVVFQLHRPFPALMLIMEATGGTIMPAHLYKDTEEYRSASANNNFIGTGPFKFKDWRKGSYIHLVKNSDYWEANKPYLDEIYFHIIPDANGRSIAFESGKVDAIRAGDVENFEINQLSQQPNVVLTNDGWEFLDPIAQLHINLRNKPMDDLRFRQALAHAIDRDFIVKNIFGGFGKELNGPFSNSYPFKDPSVETKYAYDPEKAKALLDDMGLKPDANGVRTELRLLPLPYGETWQRLAEFTREQLNRVGIKTTIVATDVPGWFKRITSGDFDLGFNYVYQLGDPAIVVSETYVTSTEPTVSTLGNLGGYSNPELDKQLLEARHTLSVPERTQQYAAIQKTLSEEVPMLWLHQMQMPTLYRQNIQNLISTGLGMNENFSDVWVKR